MTDNQYLIKLKLAGLSDEAIGKRLGITADDVSKQWSSITEYAAACGQNGHSDLSAVFGELAAQYQNLGSSMVLVSSALGDVMPPNEIRALLTNDVEQSLKNLLRGAIILRPYKKKDPEEVIKQHIRQN